ncbi:MAG: aminotransferase class I/II-fold pyridoxal phosphate-dependent enzyme [Myxococcota bacterium]
MNDAENLNATLARELPVAFRCLSPLGRRVAFPRGIPFQAAQAKHAPINATIGQITDGSGQPLPLGPLAPLAQTLDARRAFLYTPIDGPADLDDAWQARQHRLANNPSVSTSRPVVTHGLTHAMSIVADLFVDDETDVVLSNPYWENYDLLFGLRARPRFIRYDAFREGRFNVEGLGDALAQVRNKAVVVLNFPGNPTGYQPTPDEARAIAAILHAHQGPAVVVSDDAYQGWVYAEGRQTRSVFWEIADGADLERLLPIKVDGATKELVFFASRVGFLAHRTGGEAADLALRSKIKAVIRGTVGSASGPALDMVAKALAAPDLEAAFEAKRRILAERWATLREALQGLPANRATVYPFHGAFFGLLQLAPDLNAEQLRQRLIAEHGVGTIAFPDVNALRVAFCSIANERLPEVGQALAKALL